MDPRIRQLLEALDTAARSVSTDELPPLSGLPAEIIESLLREAEEAQYIKWRPALDSSPESTVPDEKAGWRLRSAGVRYLRAQKEL